MDAHLPQRARMGRLIAAAAVAAAATCADANLGQLDPTFGNAGVAALPRATDRVDLIVPLSGGRIIVGAYPTDDTDYLRSNSPDYLLFRFNADGSVDRTFGDSGQVTVHRPKGAAKVSKVLETAGGYLLVHRMGPLADGTTVMRLDAAGKPVGEARTLSLEAARCGRDSQAPYLRKVLDGWTRPDGAMLLVLDVGTIDGFGFDGPGCTVVTRLRPDGSPDPSYGSNGFAIVRTTDFGSVAHTSFLDGSGLILAGAGLWSTGWQRFVARLREDGTPDASFARAGIHEIGGIGNGVTVSVAGRSMAGNALAFLSLPRGGSSTSDYELARYSGPPGSSEFTGTSTFPWLYADWQSVYLQFDGSLVLTGRFTPQSAIEGRLQRLDATGKPDARFGGPNGVLNVDSRFPIQHLDVQAMQPDGNLLFVAKTPTPASYVHPEPPAVNSIMRITAIPPAVEFRNSTLGHYFLTLDNHEAAGIDAGAAGPGWSRTGAAFEVGGPDPTCRFYGTPGKGPNSHFFTPDPVECDLVKQDPGWTYEGIGFYVTRVGAGGTCAATHRAVHRLYNNRAAQNDSNHRFVVDTAAIPPMVAQGWIHEGPAFCVPR